MPSKSKSVRVLDAVDLLKQGVPVKITAYERRHRVTIHTIRTGGQLVLVRHKGYAFHVADGLALERVLHGRELRLEVSVKDDFAMFRITHGAVASDWHSNPNFALREYFARIDTPLLYKDSASSIFALGSKPIEQILLAFYGHAVDPDETVVITEHRRKRNARKKKFDADLSDGDYSEKEEASADIAKIFADVLAAPVIVPAAHRFRRWSTVESHESPNTSTDSLSSTSSESVSRSPEAKSSIRFEEVNFSELPNFAIAPNESRAPESWIVSERKPPLPFSLEPISLEAKSSEVRSNSDREDADNVAPFDECVQMIGTSTFGQPISKCESTTMVPYCGMMGPTAVQPNKDFQGIFVDSQMSSKRILEHSNPVIEESTEDATSPREMIGSSSTGDDANQEELNGESDLSRPQIPLEQQQACLMSTETNDSSDFNSFVSSSDAKKITGNYEAALGEERKSTSALLPPPQLEPSIMLSYAQGSEKIANEVRDFLLESRRFNVIIDAVKMPDNLGEWAMQTVSMSDVIVVLVSRAYNKSRFCEMELCTAIRLRKKVVPILLEREFIGESWLALAMAGLLYYDGSCSSKLQQSLRMIVDRELPKFKSSPAQERTSLLPLTMTDSVGGSDIASTKREKRTLGNNELLIGNEFAGMGVSLSFLASLNIDPEADFNKASEEIKRLTGSRSLASHLRQDDTTKHLVGNADYFVSYCWTGGYGKTMNALKSHFGDRDPFLWMDIAMVNQHALAWTDVDIDEWARTLPGLLKEVGKALIVLVPGERPVAVERSWCCFEWVYFKQTNIQFEYCADPNDVDRMIEKMESGNGVDVDYFYNLFSNINVESAKASKPSEQEAILNLIRRIGTKEVNDVIMLGVKNWLLHVVSLGGDRVEPGTAQSTRLLMSSSALHQALGDYASAESLLDKALGNAKQLPNNDHDIALILAKRASVVFAKGDYNSAIQLIKEALELGETCLGSTHPDLAKFLHIFAMALHAKGDYLDAEPLFRRAYDIEKECYGENDLRMTASLNSLALVYRDKGDNVEALLLYKKVLHVRETHLGLNHPDVATSCSNLAMVTCDLGNYKEAEELYRKALSIRTRCLGDYHPDVAAAYNSLADVLRYTGDYLSAEPLYRKSLEIYRKSFGEDHPNVVRTLNNLANLLRKKGDFVGAEPLFREALAISKKCLEDDHLDVATMLSQFAAMLCDKGDYTGAESLYRNALDIIEKSKGTDFPLAATLLSNLASVLSAKGDYDGSEQMYRRALDIRITILGRDHPDVARSYDSLGNILRSKGNYEGAELLLRNALSIRTRLQVNTLEIATSLNNLALVLHDRSAYHDALRFYKDALDIRRKVLGDEHPDVAATLNSQANLLREMDDVGGAEALFMEAITIQKKTLGAAHPSVASSLNNLASLLLHRGDHIGAALLYREVLAIQKCTLGDDHPDVAVSLNNLANCLYKQGEYKDAIPLYREALSIRRKVLGHGHPDLAMSMEILAWTLLRTGDSKGAKALAMEAVSIRKKASEQVQENITALLQSQLNITV